MIKEKGESRKFKSKDVQKMDYKKLIQSISYKLKIGYPSTSIYLSIHPSISANGVRVKEVNTLPSNFLRSLE